MALTEDEFKRLWTKHPAAQAQRPKTRRRMADKLWFQGYVDTVYSNKKIHCLYDRCLDTNAADYCFQLYHYPQGRGRMGGSGVSTRELYPEGQRISNTDGKSYAQAAQLIECVGQNEQGHDIFCMTKYGEAAIRGEITVPARFCSFKFDGFHVLLLESVERTYLQSCMGVRPSRRAFNKKNIALFEVPL